jgi:hypothetical protein
MRLLCYIVKNLETNEEESFESEEEARWKLLRLCDLGYRAEIIHENLYGIRTPV